MTGLALWQWVAVFAAGTVPLVLAGVELARSSDRLAAITHIDRMFIGMSLVAGVTSLPEIVTVTAAAAAGSDQLALGGLFGSSMANMAILALLDLIHRGRFWPQIELSNARTAAIAIGLTALALVGTVAAPVGALGPVGLDSIAIAVTYLVAAAWVHRSPVVVPASPTRVAGDGGVGLRGTLLRLTGSAVVIVVSGPIVATAADGIVQTSGLGATFTGVVLLAGATSLPELIVSLTALRIGALDVAVGNLFGSNALNMVVVLPVDVVNAGPALAAAPPSVAVAGAAAVGLMAMALAVIVAEQPTSVRRLEPDALAVLLAWIAALALVWTS